MKSIHTKNFRVFFSQPDRPLHVSQNMCDKIAGDLKKLMGDYYPFVLPQGDQISDAQLYRLYYLASAFHILQDKPGLIEHISEYKNDAESSFFVTLLADVLVGIGFQIEFEPNIPNWAKKPDLYVFDTHNIPGIYFECKQPKDDTRKYLQEQRKIFDGIEDVISDWYSLALFYSKELSDIEIQKLHDSIRDSLSEDPSIFENKTIVDDPSLGVKLIISGVPDSIQSNSSIEVSGIPNYSKEKGFSKVNGFNRYGKNVVFLKSASKNTILGQLKNSRNKVPEGYPYIVCIDLSDSRFDTGNYSDVLKGHFDAGCDTSFSGVVLVEHGLAYDAKYIVQMKYIENRNAKFKLPDIYTLTLHKSYTKRF